MGSIHTSALACSIDLKAQKVGAMTMVARMSLCPRIKWFPSMTQYVNGIFRLIRYDRLRYDDRDNASDKDEHFWRQTPDFATKRLLVKLQVNRV